MHEIVIVEQDPASLRTEVENLVNSLNSSTFDISDLLFKIKNKGLFNGWGFTTFRDYVGTLAIKARKADYLVKMAECMAKVAIPRIVYEPVGLAKLREITSLDPDATYVNPTTKEETPMSEFIIGFIEKANDMSIEEIKQHVRTLKGLVGEDELVFLRFSIKKIVLDETVRPALELAKNFIGSIGKDSEGNSIDPSDSMALESIAVEYLNDPNNQVIKEEN